MADPFADLPFCEPEPLTPGPTPKSGNEVTIDGDVMVGDIDFSAVCDCIAAQTEGICDCLTAALEATATTICDCIDAQTTGLCDCINTAIETQTTEITTAIETICEKLEDLEVTILNDPFTINIGNLEDIPIPPVVIMPPCQPCITVDGVVDPFAFIVIIDGAPVYYNLTGEITGVTAVLDPCDPLCAPQSCYVEPIVDCCDCDCAPGVLAAATAEIFACVNCDGCADCDPAALAAATAGVFN